MEQPTYWPPSDNDVSGRRLQRSLSECKAAQEIWIHFGGKLAKRFHELLKHEPARQMIASDLLKITDPDGVDKSLKRAFDEAGLDHGNPLHWRQLISLLAEAHFGPRMKRTADPERPERLIALFRKASEVNGNHRLDWNVSAIAKKLRESDRKQFAGVKEDAVRKQIEEALRFVREILVGQFPGMPLTNSFIKQATKGGRSPARNLVEMLSLGEFNLSKDLENKAEK